MTRRLPTAAGAGITTFLLVAVIMIEFLDTEFSAIIGLPAGLFVGVAVLIGCWITLDERSDGVRRAASAYASIGLVALLLLVLSYVNIGRSVLSVEVLTGITVGTAVAVYGVLLASERRNSATRKAR